MNTNDYQDMEFEMNFSLYKDQIEEAPAELQDKIRERLQTQNDRHDR